MSPTAKACFDTDCSNDPRRAILASPCRSSGAGSPRRSKPRVIARQLDFNLNTSASRGPFSCFLVRKSLKIPALSAVRARKRRQCCDEIREALERGRCLEHDQRRWSETTEAVSVLVVAKLFAAVVAFGRVAGHLVHQREVDDRVHRGRSVP